MARRLPVLALVGTLLVSGVLTASATARTDPSARTDRARTVGNEPFRAGTPYTGNFPDPTVLRLGTTYYAASTTVAALSLPMMTSRDLRRWVPRPAASGSRPDDAMPSGAAWARTKTSAGGKVFWPTWAPTLMRLKAGRFLAAYAVPQASDGRRCVTVATATRAWGPYVDRTPGPLTCGIRSAIDPSFVRAADGSLWMLYKWGASPDRLLARRLLPSGTGWWPNSRNHFLLAPRLAWEGSTVENPAMIRFRKRLYLFYSANDYRTARYATGYATCRTVVGPCTRRGRLLPPGPYHVGQGGAAPFLDRAGRLRLAYHAWRKGQVGFPAGSGCENTSAGCPQRRMYVATLGATKRGTLVVHRRF